MSLMDRAHYAGRLSSEVVVGHAFRIAILVPWETGNAKDAKQELVKHLLDLLSGSGWESPDLEGIFCLTGATVPSSRVGLLGRH